MSSASSRTPLSQSLIRLSVTVSAGAKRSISASEYCQNALAASAISVRAGQSAAVAMRRAITASVFKEIQETVGIIAEEGINAVREKPSRYGGIIDGVGEQPIARRMHLRRQFFGNKRPGAVERRRVIFFHPRLPVGRDRGGEIAERHIGQGFSHFLQCLRYEG